MITYLKVPYDEKDKARKLGAKWNAARKTWYVEDVENMEAFLRWIPDHLKQPVGGQKKSPHDGGHR